MTSSPPHSNTARRPASESGRTTPTRRTDGDPKSRASAFDFWVFDLDGTLIDIEPWYRRALLDRIGTRLNYRFSDHEVDRLWYGLGEGRAEVLQSAGIDPDRFWRVFHDEEDPMARARASFLYEDAAVVATLDGPVGLVTHCQQYLTDPVLRTLGIQDWFDAVVCCTDATGWKPAPGPVDLTMSEMGVDPARSQGALVGDDPDDSGAAWNAGLASIHVQRYDPLARGQCILGDHRVTSLWDLPV